jgi:starch synthase
VRALKILIATSEATPLAKTGGLADVCGSLPLELAKLGHEPILIMPAFQQVRQSGCHIEPTGVAFNISIGNKQVAGSFLKTSLGDGRVPVFLVEQNQYYNRPELYRADGRDYTDNCERFVFFSRAVLEAVRLLSLNVDIIHANDWQTGLVPAYLRILYRNNPGYERIGTLFTIHNMAYQGVFWHWDMLLTGLDWKYFNWQQMEFFGSLNLLKTGLIFADRLNTVSPRYAEEIQSAPLGCGLEGVLQQRREVLSGIINGVDYSDWNPATDSHLAANYGPDNPLPGKAVCKAALQSVMGLPESARIPLLGVIGRLVEQKGVDLIAAVMREWVQSQNVQWVLLGTGESNYQEMLQNLAKRFPQKAAVRLEFSDPLAHQIEAGADIFLMPSRFEPCGLNQLYSLKYGTIPVVRGTGGLADSVTDLQEENLPGRTPTGFVFHDYSALTFSEALHRACNVYAQPDVWRRLMVNGMRQDWSWTQSARHYSDLYARIAASRRQPQAGSRNG